ncbi:unnamed protein product, partial [Symbiodinium sp. KB8]
FNVLPSMCLFLAVPVLFAHIAAVYRWVDDGCRLRSGNGEFSAGAFFCNFLGQTAVALALLIALVVGLVAAGEFVVFDLDASETPSLAAILAIIMLVHLTILYATSALRAEVHPAQASNWCYRQLTRIMKIVVSVAVFLIPLLLGYTLVVVYESPQELVTAVLVLYVVACLFFAPLRKFVGLRPTQTVVFSPKLLPLPTLIVDVSTGYVEDITSSILFGYYGSLILVCWAAVECYISTWEYTYVYPAVFFIVSTMVISLTLHFRVKAGTTFSHAWELIRWRPDAMSRFRNLVQDTEAMVRVANPGRSFGISITLPRLHFKRTEKQLQRIQRVADQLKQEKERYEKRLRFQALVIEGWKSQFAREESALVGILEEFLRNPTAYFEHAVLEGTTADGVKVWRVGEVVLPHQLKDYWANAKSIDALRASPQRLEKRLRYVCPVTWQLIMQEKNRRERVAIAAGRKEDQQEAETEIEMQTRQLLDDQWEKTTASKYRMFH